MRRRRYVQEPFMPIADKVRRYLDKKRIIYDAREVSPFTSLLAAASAAGVAPSATVQISVLKDVMGLIIVLLPANYVLDLDALSSLLHRRLEPASELQIQQVFSDCDPRFVPPLAEVYGVRSIVDQALMACADLYFAGGDAHHLLRVSSKDFFNVLSNGWLAGHFTRPLAAQDLDSNAAIDMKKRIHSLMELPALPQMARRRGGRRAGPGAGAGRRAGGGGRDP